MIETNPTNNPFERLYILLQITNSFWPFLEVALVFYNEFRENIS